MSIRVLLIDVEGDTMAFTQMTSIRDFRPHASEEALKVIDELLEEGVHIQEAAFAVIETHASHVGAVGTEGRMKYQIVCEYSKIDEFIKDEEFLINLDALLDED